MRFLFAFVEEAGSAATPPSRGTGRFNANLFLGVNYATLIFTQLCSSAQGTAAIQLVSAPTCPEHSRLEVTSLFLDPTLARISSHDWLLWINKACVLLCYEIQRFSKVSVISHCSSFFLLLPFSHRLSSFRTS